MEAWRKNLLYVWLAQVFSVSGFQFVVPFLPLFIQDLGISNPADIRFYVGLISGLPALFMGLMAVPWGLISDRFGRKIMVLRAVFFGSFLMFWMSRASSITEVIIIRILQGLLTGAITAGTTLIAANTPRHAQSKALGILASSAFIGLTVGPFIGGVTAAAFGYRNSFLIGSGAIAVSFFLVLFLVKETSHKAIKTSKKKKKKTYFSSMIISGLVLIFIIRFSRALSFPYITLYVQELTGPESQVSFISGSIIAATGIASAIAGVVLVHFEKRFGKRFLLVLYMMLAFFSSIPIFLQDSLFGFSLFNVLTMFFIGGLTPLLQSSLGGALQKNRQGIAFGIQTLIGNLGWFIAPLVGASIAIHYNIITVFFALTVILFLGSIIGYLFFERTKDG